MRKQNYFGLMVFILRICFNLNSKNGSQIGDEAAVDEKGYFVSLSMT